MDNKLIKGYPPGGVEHTAGEPRYEGEIGHPAEDVVQRCIRCNGKLCSVKVSWPNLEQLLLPYGTTVTVWGHGSGRMSSTLGHYEGATPCAGGDVTDWA